MMTDKETIRPGMDTIHMPDDGRDEALAEADMTASAQGEAAGWVCFQLILLAAFMVGMAVGLVLGGMG